MVSGRLPCLRSGEYGGNTCSIATSGGPIELIRKGIHR
jgi:hypothetical protein